jgi:hypothetical protein
MTQDTIEGSFDQRPPLDCLNDAYVAQWGNMEQIEPNSTRVSKNQC